MLRSSSVDNLDDLNETEKVLADIVCGIKQVYHKMVFNSILLQHTNYFFHSSHIPLTTFSLSPSLCLSLNLAAL